jgi:hypothetical protein
VKKYSLHVLSLVSVLGIGGCTSSYQTEFEEIGGDQPAMRVVTQNQSDLVLTISSVSMNRPYSSELLNDLKAKIENTHAFKRVQLSPDTENVDLPKARLTVSDTRVDRRGLRPLSDSDYPEAYEGAFVQHRYQLTLHWPTGSVGFYEAKCGGLLEGNGPMNPVSQERLHIEEDHCLNALVKKVVSDIPGVVRTSGRIKQK